jgi:hypothetical protein
MLAQPKKKKAGIDFIFTELTIVKPYLNIVIICYNHTQTFNWPSKQLGTSCTFQAPSSMKSQVPSSMTARWPRTVSSCVPGWTCRPERDLKGPGRTGVELTWKPHINMAILDVFCEQTTHL